MQKLSGNVGRRLELGPLEHAERAQIRLDNSLDRPEARFYSGLSNSGKRKISIADCADSLGLAGNPVARAERLSDLESVECRRFAIQIETQRREQTRKEASPEFGKFRRQRISHPHGFESADAREAFIVVRCDERDGLGFDQAASDYQVARALYEVASRIW